MSQFFNQFLRIIEHPSDDESLNCNKDTISSNVPDITEVIDYPPEAIFPYIIEDDTSCLQQRPNIFSVIKYTNPGRKPKDNIILRKKHKRSAFDNIQTKIQVHFINFLIDFANDAIYTEFKETKPFFDKINYEDKKKVKFDYLQKLFSSPINQIITLNVSTKYKKDFDSSHNRKVYEELTKESSWLKSFLDIIYIDMFEKYYNNKEPLRNYIFDGKEICLSETTKSFYYLLKKNKAIKNEIIDTTEKVYLNRKNEKIPFKINKFDN